MDFQAEAAGLRVAMVRGKLDISQGELARRAGVSRGYVVEFEKGEQRNPRQLTLDGLARGLGWRDWAALMSTDALEPPPALRLTDDLGTSVDNRLTARIQEVSRVPYGPVPGGNANALRGPVQPPHLARLLITHLMGVKVLSVHPQDRVSADALVVGDHVDVDGTVAIPTEMAANRTLWAVRVSGSCMEPEISAGDVVVIEIGRAPMDGEVVCVEYEGRTLVKRWWDEGPRVHLVANRDGDSVDAAKEDVVVIGVVVSGVYEVIRQPRRYRRAG